jgi:hypothetical protein
MEFTHIANPVRVVAKVIDVVDHRCDGTGVIDLTLEDETHFVLIGSMSARYTPAIGDYLVTQEDGYQYVNPKAVFERKYRPLEANEEFDKQAALEMIGLRSEVGALDDRIAELEAENERLRELEKANSWANAAGLDARSVCHALVMQMITGRTASAHLIAEIDQAVQYVMHGTRPESK